MLFILIFYHPHPGLAGLASQTARTQDHFSWHIHLRLQEKSNCTVGM